MIAVLTLFVVVIISLLVVRVATVALIHTGISKDLARFEARSAFTNAGYTTLQSEQIIHHPVRRKIVMLLMLLGSAGHVTVISSLILSFVARDEDVVRGPGWIRMVALFAGLAILWIVGHSRWIDGQITLATKWALKRFYKLDFIDYVGLLHLAGEYEVAELVVTADSWLVDNSLADLRLTDENLLVLGVNRKGEEYVGTPDRDFVLLENDNLIIYGPKSVIQDVDCRSRGESGRRAHLDSVQRQAEADAESSASDSLASGRK